MRSLPIVSRRLFVCGKDLTNRRGYASVLPLNFHAMNSVVIAVFADTLEQDLALKVGSSAAKHLRIVGFHFVGMNAGEITQPFALALRVGVTKADLDATVRTELQQCEVYYALARLTLRYLWNRSVSTRRMQKRLRR